MKKSIYLKILITLLAIAIMLGIVGFIRSNENKKIAEIEKGEITTVESVALEPVEKATLDKGSNDDPDMIYLQSTNAEILRRVVNALLGVGIDSNKEIEARKERWDSYYYANRVPIPSGKYYYINIPKELNEDNYFRYIQHLDFSGININEYTEFPNLNTKGLISHNVLSINFNNSGNSNVVEDFTPIYNAFKKGYFGPENCLNYLKVDLQYNAIEDITSNEWFLIKNGENDEGQVFNVQNQRITKKLGNIEQEKKDSALGSAGDGVKGVYMPKLFQGKTYISGKNRTGSVVSIGEKAVSIDISSIGRNKTGKVTATEGRFKGSTVTYEYSVISKGTTGNSNPPEDISDVPQGGTTGGGGGYDDYYYPMSFDMSVKCSDQNKLTNKKTITISITGTNIYPGSAQIYVNNKLVNNSNGTAKYTATKNGTYNILARYPGISGDETATIKLTNIDSTKPSYTYTKEVVKGSSATTINITAVDDTQLKRIAVNGANIFNESGYKTRTVPYKVPKTGSYKIEVEDTAGNIYSKTEKFHIDVTSPQIKNITVIKDTKVGYVGNTDDGSYCRAKIGNIITVTMTAHENIASHGEITLNGKTYTAKDVKLDEKTLSFKIELTQDVVNTYALNGYVEIGVKSLKDKFNNTGDYTNKKLLYLDKVAPTVKQVNLEGGTTSEDGEVIEIYKDQKIKIIVVMSEGLSTSPIIDLGGLAKTATYEKEVTIDGKKYPQYALTVDTNDLIEKLDSQNIKDSFIAVTIKDFVDNAGIKGTTYRIDGENKANNGVSLVYGKRTTGKLYFVGTRFVPKTTVGDINMDGYINDYDMLLLARHLSKQEDLSQKTYEIVDGEDENGNDIKAIISQTEYANIDGKGSINVNDRTALEKKLQTVKNKIYANVTDNFKIYDGDNKPVVIDNVELVVEQGNNIISLQKVNDGNGDKVVKLTTGEQTGEILIKATCSDGTEKGQLAGELKLSLDGISQGQGGFENISDSKINIRLMGDVNSDGLVTNYDGIMVQRYTAKIEEFTDYQKEVARVTDDDKINIRDTTAIQKQEFFTYNGMKKGDSVKLKIYDENLNTYNPAIENQVSDDLKGKTILWTVQGNANAVTITPNNQDGSATITINDNAVVGEKIRIECNARFSAGDERKTGFNIEVIDKATVELSHSEIQYNLTNLPKDEEELKNSLEVLSVETNIINKAITWKSADENIAKVEVDDFGKATVIPVKAGKTQISATVDGVSATCTVDISESITGIEVEKETIEVFETLEEEVKITVTPSTATENAVMKSADENIAKVYYDKETGKYKIAAISKGSTTITVTSPSNDKISKTIQVNVKELEVPTLKTITIEQADGEQVYKANDKLNMKFVFTNKIKGEAPNLKIKFGNYKSVGEPKFVEIADNDTALVYQYEIQEGDNGILTIEKLEDGKLTDETGIIDAILTVQPTGTYESEDVEYIPTYDEIIQDSDIEEGLETGNSSIYYRKSAQMVKATATTQEGTGVESEIVSSGIHRPVTSVIADTTKPTLSIAVDIDKDSYWLKKGDVAKVKITASEELSNAPTVTMGGVTAKVEGSGKEFVASTTITEEIEEGYLEIKATGYKDLVGNEGNELIAKEENIDQPIIVDYSGTKIKSIELITEKGKEYKAGDKFKIRVTFLDATKERNEFIGAKEAPIINIKFGDKDAQGQFENNYVSEKYVDNIIYTYTISENDDGKIAFDGISGTISDVAGNTTDLSSIKDLPAMEAVTVDNDDPNGDGSNDNGSNDNGSNDNGSNGDGSNDDGSNNNGSNNDKIDIDINGSNKKEETDGDGKKDGGILPNTGAGMVKMGLTSTLIVGLIAGAYIMKRKKIRIRIRFK